MASIVNKVYSDTIIIYLFKYNKILIIQNFVEFVFKYWSYRTGHQNSSLYKPLPRLNINFLSALPQ